MQLVVTQHAHERFLERSGIKAHRAEYARRKLGTILARGKWRILNPTRLEVVYKLERLYAIYRFDSENSRLILVTVLALHRLDKPPRTRAKKPKKGRGGK